VKEFWRSRNLGVVLLVLFLVSWAVQAWAGWREFQAEQATLGESAAVFGSSGYIWTFLAATMENWQSEFLQLLAFVVLTSFLIFKGSPESRDGQDEMMAAIDRIEQRVDELSRPGRSNGPVGANGPARISR
jgi:hypothetical protein